MPRIVSLASLVFITVVSSAYAGDVLVRYDFDGSRVDTGPWLTTFEHAKGRVELTTGYRFSGSRSVEITDVAGDGTFAELQGFYPRHDSGRVSIRFALMTAEPGEELNVAFAGPGHFFMQPDGMAVWFKCSNGTLQHMTAETWQPLLTLRPFTWYAFEVIYDVDAGTYDLRIVEEGDDEASVFLEDQPNATGLPGSTIEKFSFIGAEPGRDDSDVVFYVDDIVIGTDTARSLGGFVAPGRRMLFVDMYDLYRKRLYQQPGCPPVVGPADFGLDAYDLQELIAAGHGALYQTLADQRALEVPVPESLSVYLSTALRAMVLWQEGCSTARQDADGPLAAFRGAAELTREAKVYPMSELLALVARNQWQAADELLASIYPDWHDDPRFPALSATIGIARGDLADAEAWLDRVPYEQPAEPEHELVRELWAGRFSRSLVEQLQSELPDAWQGYVRQALILDQRFDVLLWQRDHAAALEYAARMAERLESMGLPAGRWHERRGDAAFFAGDYDAAGRSYEQGLRDATDPIPMMLKLSDVHFKLGNVDLERSYREKIYGSLEPEDNDGSPRIDRCNCPPQPVGTAGAADRVR